MRRVENFAEDGRNQQLGIAKLDDNISAKKASDSKGLPEGKDLLLEPYEQICTEKNGGFDGGAVKRTASTAIQP